MLEQAVFGVLALHRQFPQYIDNQARRLWREAPSVPTAKRRIGVLGQGPVWQAASRKLESLGFPVLPGNAAQCDILLWVSPGDLPEQACIDVLAGLSTGASVVIAGLAGAGLLAALRVALASGRLSAAYLALESARPLPADDPLWAHPHVMIAPLA
jgi:glyoxylate/hydroxypyruvate reductase A